MGASMQRLPRPDFDALVEAFRPKKSQMHVCSVLDVAAGDAPLLSAVNLSEAVLIATGVAPHRGDFERVHAPKGSAFDHPMLGAYGYGLYGTMCPHGIAQWPAELSQFLQDQWGEPTNYAGDGEPEPELRGRRGVICFVEVFGHKARAHIDLWDGHKCLVRAYWNAPRILFWDLDRDGMSGTGSAGEPEEVSWDLKPKPSAVVTEAPTVEKPTVSSPAPKPSGDEVLNRYCPDMTKKAPEPFIDSIEAQDLRNFEEEVNKHGSEAGKISAYHAMFGQPGGATDEKDQAFWSGGEGGMKAARDHEFTIQEDGGGAGELDALGKAGANPKWEEEAGAGSKITGERLWKTISRRSAENAKGTVDAFVVGKARKDNVFASVELPTLLHNPNLTQINFRDPDHPPPGPVVSSWKKGADGCWEGGPVPPGTAKPGDKYPPAPGFQLSSKSGFIRE